MSTFHHVKLGYLGLLPFLLLTGGYFLTEADWLLQSFIIYSISILSFVAGSLWQPATKTSVKGETKTISQSHTQAWLVVLVTLPLPLSVFVAESVVLICLALSFVWLLALQKRLASWPEMTPDYQQMRGKITAVVFVCHLFMLAQINHTPELV
ncbi:DUF3429 domain-containing protein [Motilimonas sp. 1_MG-2023]|uniref:DUF3429 domain-containing protein n=1 Tax=Motilimonas sp. 1_MG-2023 TaxID=3062672 RepID=UPI0026E45A95|nr:DUF3429 domain-containing protein [Motilimonas sp. 1_MG-2023]MDO6525042.1 DUF3429 domain-containing protein [Motilimonas sp. 1_MG-2023]